MATSHVMRQRRQPAPASYRDLNVHKDGHEVRRALLDAIEAARHSIGLCTFIVGRDALGDAVIDRLCSKARSGVRVRRLLDGLGYWNRTISRALPG